MLSNFLKTIDPAYKIEFRTDRGRDLLIVRVTRGFLFKEAMISYEFLCDEQRIIKVIRDTIDLLDDAFNNYD
jgi:hypothetical protein